MTKEEFKIERTRIISKMFDNPDKYGIYSTTECFEQLDELYDGFITSQSSAEDINRWLAENIGEPDNSIEDHSYEIRPLTVEGRQEWWMFHNGVGSGEPLAQWIEKFVASQRQPQPTAYEWHNFKTGHCYVDYVPHLDAKEGYTKVPLYSALNVLISEGYVEKAAEGAEEITDSDIENAASDYIDDLDLTGKSYIAKLHYAYQEGAKDMRNGNIYKSPKQ
jgi:hypothetical protein